MCVILCLEEFKEIDLYIWQGIVGINIIIPSRTQIHRSGTAFMVIRVRVGAKIKSEIPNPESKLEDIGEEWSKIEPIIKKQKCDDFRHGVFITNIERG